MKNRYKILGTRRFGEAVRLIIESDELIQEKRDFNPMEMISNPDGMQAQMQKMQTDALIKQQPDMITISYSEWLDHKYNTDDIIWIELTTE